MSNRSRRNHSAAFKAKVALEVLKGQQTVIEITERFDVHPTQVTHWKIQLLERDGGAFGVRQTKSPARMHVPGFANGTYRAEVVCVGAPLRLL